MASAELRLVGDSGNSNGGHGHDHTKPADDPWSTSDSGGYSVDEVYARSTDGRGHSVNLQTKVSPEIAGEIGALVASGVIPDYRTPQDFFRDAAIHRLKYWADKQANGELQRRVTTEMILARTERDESEMVELAKLVETKSRVFDVAMRAKDWATLERMVEQAEGEVEYLREPFRAKMMEVIARGRKELKGKV